MQKNSSDLYIENKREQYLFILCISLGAFMANLDITIVNTALPTISREMSVSPGQASIILLVYQIFEAGFLLTFGRIGDLIGFRKVYILGFVLFTLGSLFCGLSENIEVLVASRALQGLGGAMLFAVMMASVVRYIPNDKKGMAMGIVTTSAALGVAVGPMLGGLISTVYNWRLIFMANVPVGIIATIIGLRVFPKTFAKLNLSKIDPQGTILSFIATTSLVLGFYFGHNAGWLSSLTIPAMIVFVISGGLFVYRESRSDAPLLDLHIFRNRNFLLTALASMPSFMLTAGLLFIMPFYFELLIKFTPAVSGMILTTLAFGQLTGPFAGKLADRFGSRKTLAFGMILGIVSLSMLILGLDVRNYVVVVISLLVFGTSLGFCKAPNVALAIEYSPPDKKGVVSSVMGVIRSFSILIGVLVFERVFSFFINSRAESVDVSLKSLSLSPAALIKGFQASFFLGLALAVIALLLLLGTRKTEYIKQNIN